MGVIVNAIYSSFPGLADLEKKTEEAINSFSHAFKIGKSIGDYVLNNTDRIINALEKSITSYVSGLINTFKQDFLGSYAKSYAKSNVAGEKKEDKKETKEEQRIYEKKQEAKPITNPIAIVAEKKKSTLDELVNDFKHKIKRFNPAYDVSIDVYDNGSVIKSYAVSHKNQAEEKPAEKAVEYVLENKVVADDNPGDKYVRESLRIAELYNQGYKTRWIVKEAAKNGYVSVKNHQDITEMVAAAISSGAAYTRGNYNNAVATKLGAREQIINDYVAGKSYKEIKENLKKNTNGMNISDSSILRIMHGYEQKQGKKVVGQRISKARKSRGKPAKSKSKK